MPDNASVKPGDNIEYTADTFNSIIDAANIATGTRGMGAVYSASTGRPRVRIFNDSEQFIPRFGVVALSRLIQGYEIYSTDTQWYGSVTVGQVFDERVETAASGFKVITLFGRKPTDGLSLSTEWAIVQDNVEPGGIVDVVVYGPTIARVFYPGTGSGTYPYFSPVSLTTHAIFASLSGNGSLISKLEGALPADDQYDHAGTQDGKPCTKDSYALIRIGSGVGMRSKRIYGTAVDAFTQNTPWVKISVTNASGEESGIQVYVRNPAISTSIFVPGYLFSGDAGAKIWAEWWPTSLSKDQSPLAPINLKQAGAKGSYMIYQSNCPAA